MFLFTQVKDAFEVIEEAGPDMDPGEWTTDDEAMGRRPKPTKEERKARKKERKAKWDKWKRELPGNTKTYFVERAHPFKSLNGFKFWFRLVVSVLIAFFFYRWRQIRANYESKFLAFCAFSDFEQECGAFAPDEECLFKVEARMESQTTASGEKVRGKLYY